MGIRGATAAKPTDETSFIHLVQQIGAAIDANQGMDTMRHVWETDRWFTFPKFHETAEYLKTAMTAAGLQDVEIVDAPADGVTRAGAWTLPLAWDVKQAKLEIVEPSVKPKQRVLADYEAIPTAVGMWSGPTPPGGITTELVAIGGSDDLKRIDVKGKLVLTPYAHILKPLLVAKGAIGAVNTYSENRTELPNDRQWMNAWGDNGWGFTKNNAPLVFFSVSPAQAADLMSLLSRHKVMVHATVDSRYYAGGYPYVTGVIRGASPEEEVLTLGHAFEQGAHDNATGVAAMMESLATLARLTHSGQLPAPRRSIRILVAPEIYGASYWVQTHPEIAHRTVAAMNLDTPAAPYKAGGTEYTFHFNPHASKSYTDALVLHAADAWLSNLKPRRPCHAAPFVASTDTWLADPMVGIPTLWPYSGTGVNSHHNSADRPETVDPKSLRDLAAITASFLYFVASAGEGDLPWLTQITLAQAKEEVTAARQVGPKQVAYAADRGAEAIRSILRLVKPEQRAAAAGTLEPALADLHKFAAEQKSDGKDAPAAAAEADPNLAEAAGMVVKRKVFGTIPLDELPDDQRDGIPTGGNPAAVALFWCDGHRNLAEVIRLTRMELGPEFRMNIVGYFRFLERHGYVEIRHV
jgi:hypothetical protein